MPKRTESLHTDSMTSLASGDRRITLVIPAGSSRSSSTMSSRGSTADDAAGIPSCCEPTPDRRSSGLEQNTMGTSFIESEPCNRAWISDSFVLACRTNDGKPKPSRKSDPAISSRIDASRSIRAGGKNRRYAVRRGAELLTFEGARTSFSMKMEWMNAKKSEIYNVASNQLRRMLHTPAMPLDLNGLPEGAFAGPLLQIFPDSKFPRPARVDCAEWDEVMGVGKWGYPAEDSGLVTFWQAILVNVHWLRGGLGALDSLTTQGCTARVQSQLCDCVSYPMGQLVNAIGLSWEHHHVRNLKRMDDATRKRINIQSLCHRHDNLQSKIWAILLKVQGLAFLKTQAERVQAVRDAHRKLEEFYVYLIYTIRIIMEDTLFLYRLNLNEQQMSCLCDMNGLLSDPLDADLIQQALMLIAGGTPMSQWKKRFGYMGHGWCARQTVFKKGLTQYRKMFLNPIKQVLRAAAELSNGDDVSPVG